MSGTEEDRQAENKAPDGMTGQKTYNIVSDTVTGPNVRLKDNVIQGIVILVCLVLGAGIGAIVVSDRIPGALVAALSACWSGCSAAASS